MQNKTLFLARSAAIACVYVVLTLAVGWLGYGPIQFRLGEALAVLPLFYLEAIPGLTIGCLIANIFSPSPFDMILGTLATLLAAIATRACKKIYAGVVPPIVLNALIVPLIFILDPAQFGDAASTPYLMNMLTVGASQLVVVGVLGTALYFMMRPAVSRVPVLRPLDWKMLWQNSKHTAALPSEVEQDAQQDESVSQSASDTPQDAREPKS